MEQIRKITSQLEMLLGSLTPGREKAMVTRWKDEIDVYGKRRADKQKVLDAIADGYDTMVEMISQTKLPRSTCYKILKRLLREGIITKTKAARSSKNCSGSSYEFRYLIADSGK